MGQILTMRQQPHTTAGMQSVSDEELVERTREGESAAFDELVSRYKDRVYGYTLRMLRDPEISREVSQDVFLRAYRYLKGFRGDSKFSTWLYTIVSSTCKNAQSYYGLRARHAATDGPAQDEEGNTTTILDRVPDRTNAPDDMTEQRELGQVIKNAIEKLPEHYKQVIILKDINNFSYEEISKVVGCRIGTVKSRLARARSIMKDELVRAGVVGPEGI